MFFDQILLFRQHRATLGVAWIAATRGARFLQKKQIVEVKIVALCDDILRYLVNGSMKPRERFSLRLSCVLVTGALRIYDRQVTLVLDEVVSLLSKPFVTVKPSPGKKIKKKPRALDSGDLETPLTPVTGTRKRKRASAEKPPESPEQVVQQMVAQVLNEELPEHPEGFMDVPSANVARVDEITLRDPDPIQTVAGDEDFGFGLVITDEQMEHLLNGADFQPPPVGMETEDSPPNGATFFEVQAEVHATATGSPIHVISLEDVPAKEIPSIAAVPSIEPPMEETPTPIEVVPATAIPKKPKAPPRRAKIPPASPSTPKKRKISQKPLKLQEPKRRTPRLIDRDDEVMNKRLPLPRFWSPRVGPILTRLLNEYVVQVPGAEGTRDSAASKGSSSVSQVRGAGERPSLLTTPLQDSLQLSRKSTPSFMEADITARPQDVPQLMIEEETPLIDAPSELKMDEPVVSTYYSYSVSVPQATFPEDFAESAEQKRRQRIINALSQSNAEYFTVEDLIPERPIGRIHVAVCFNDLLVLCKAQFVVLIPEEGSCELQYIKRGSNFLKV